MQAGKPVTTPRVSVPEGETIEDIMARLEISIKETELVVGGWNTNYCCVDASVVSPFSTVSHSPGIGPD